IPIGLLFRNLPMVRKTNGHDLEHFAQQMADALPAKPCVVLSDDPYRLTLLRAFHEKTAGHEQNLLLDTTALPFAAYHRHLYLREPQFRELLLKTEAMPPFIA